MCRTTGERNVPLGLHTVPFPEAPPPAPHFPNHTTPNRPRETKTGTSHNCSRCFRANCRGLRATSCPRAVTVLFEGVVKAHEAQLGSGKKKKSVWWKTSAGNGTFLLWCSSQHQRHMGRTRQDIIPQTVKHGEPIINLPSLSLLDAETSRSLIMNINGAQHVLNYFKRRDFRQSGTLTPPVVFSPLACPLVLCSTRGRDNVL